MLEPGEVLIWSGQPHPSLSLIRPTSREWMIGALGAVGFLAVLVIARMVDSHSAAGWLFAGMLGAVLVAGIPFRQMRQRQKQMGRVNYAVTNRRVITLDARDPRSLRDWRLPRGAVPQIDPEPGDLSTLHFGGKSPRLAHLPNGAAIANLIAQALNE